MLKIALFRIFLHEKMHNLLSFLIGKLITSFVLQGAPTFLKSQSSLTGTVYHVSVYTGHRGGSGTSAIPILIMSGKTVDSQPIVLKSDERVLFERGSVETFILKTDLVSENQMFLIFISFLLQENSIP